jgi:hypothetical protein
VVPFQYIATTPQYWSHRMALPGFLDHHAIGVVENGHRTQKGGNSKAAFSSIMALRWANCVNNKALN